MRINHRKGFSVSRPARVHQARLPHLHWRAEPGVRKTSAPAGDIPSESDSQYLVTLLVLGHCYPTIIKE